MPVSRSLHPIPMRLFFTVCSLLGVASGRADEAPEPRDINQDRPAFFVRAHMDRPSAVYQNHEEMSLSVVSERDAYVYVLYQQTDGRVFQVFPNSIHPNNRIAAQQEVILGGSEDRFRWIAAPPFGAESITVIASENPIHEMSRREQIAREFNPVSAGQLKGVAIEVNTPAVGEWVSTHLPIRTCAVKTQATPSVDTRAPTPVRQSSDAADDPQNSPQQQHAESVQDPPTRKPARFGLFIGVGKHRFADEEQRLRGTSSDLDGPENGAREMREIMQRDGQFDRCRTLVNSKATRASIEHAIDDIAGASIPDDTIFIYYCGHTAQIPDDNGDEKDGLDELITTHDSTNLGVFMDLQKQLIDGSIDPVKEVQVIDLLTKIARAGFISIPAPDDLPWINGAWVLREVIRTRNEPVAKAIQQLVCRETFISDDVMGHWLQKLDGRKVVLIMDTCHAGGHATIEKGFKNHSTEAFDFLDSEACRLKDIGQRDLALMASSSVKQVSKAALLEDLNGRKREIGVFTHLLVHAIQEIEGPLTVTEAHATVKSVMELISDEHPESAQHTYLFNDLTSPVFIKPPVNQ